VRVQITSHNVHFVEKQGRQIHVTLLTHLSCNFLARRSTDEGTLLGVMLGASLGMSLGMSLGTSLGTSLFVLCEQNVVRFFHEISTADIMHYGIV
jgi:hypothetical protein